MAVIGVGIDLVDVSDADRLLARWGERLLHRVLTEKEREYVLRFREPGKYLAVRLAAKEAVYKALQNIPGAGEVRWRDIEVIRHNNGRPTIELHREAQRVAAAASVVRISLSLTHTERTAGAVALLERE